MTSTGLPLEWHFWALIAFGLFAGFGAILAGWAVAEIGNERRE